MKTTRQRPIRQIDSYLTKKFKCKSYKNPSDYYDDILITDKEDVSSWPILERNNKFINAPEINSIHDLISR